MASTYCAVYYHFVWSTSRREPLIAPEIEPDLYAYIRGKCSELGVFVYALDGMPDHTHLVCSLPTSLSIADCLQRVKGASSHLANQLTGHAGTFWQPGYGAFTVSKRDLARVVAYVQNQKAHHKENGLWPELERTGDG